MRKIREIYHYIDYSYNERRKGRPISFDIIALDIESARTSRLPFMPIHAHGEKKEGRKKKENAERK